MPATNTFQDMRIFTMYSTPHILRNRDDEEL